MSLGGGPLTLLEGDLRAPLTNGDHWLAAASRNRAGVVSPVQWTIIRVDAQPPKIGLQFEPEPLKANGLAWLPPWAKLEVLAVDRVAGVDTVGAEVAAERRRSATVPLEISLPADHGDVRILAEATDRVGNRAERAVTVTVDARPPEVVLEVGGPVVERDVGLVAGPSANVVEQANDNDTGIGGITRELDGQAIEAWPASFMHVLEGGAHRARMEARDGVGNAAVAEIDFTVDDRPPKIRWQVAADRSVETSGGTVYSSPVELRVTASDDLAGVVRVTVWSGGEAFAVGDGVPVMLTTDRAILRSVDAVDNRAEIEAEWLIDADPPRLSLVTADGELHQPDQSIEIPFGQSVTVEASDLAGVADLRTAQRRRNWIREVPFRSAGTQSFSSPGTYWVMARSEDHLGHAGRAIWQVRVRRPE